MDVTEQLAQYRQDAVNTASPEHLTLMLYEAALQGVREYRTHLTENPTSALSDSRLPRDILAALADNVNMNHAQGGLIKNLYLYCWRTLVASATTKTDENLDSVETVLGNLIEGLKAFSAKDAVATKGDEPISINFAG